MGWFALVFYLTLFSGLCPRYQAIYLISSTTEAANEEVELTSPRNTARRGVSVTPSDVSQHTVQKISSDHSSEPTTHTVSEKALEFNVTEPDRIVREDKGELTGNATASILKTLKATNIFGDGSIQQELLMNPPNNSYSGFSSSCEATSERRLCGCTSACIHGNNCCYDSDYVGSPPDPVLKHKCYTDFNNKWILSAPNILTDRCAQDWTVETTRELCENSNTGDFRSYVPCYSQKSGLNFKNVFCLKCNHYEHCSPWGVTFESLTPFNFADIETYGKMNAVAGKRPLTFRGQQFMVSPMPDQEPSHCTPGIIVDQCKPEFTTELLTKTCKAYYSPILIDDMYYRNAHCYRCFTGKSAARTDSDTVRQIHTMLSAVLDWTTLTSPQEPIIKRIRGFREVFLRYLLTEVTGVGEWNGIAIDKFRTQWQLLLQQKVKSSLSNLDVKCYVDVLDRDKKLDKFAPFNFQVMILDDIPIGNIASIQNIIRYIGFELSINDTVHISCCYDENGKKFTAPANRTRETTLSNMNSTVIRNRPATSGFNAHYVSSIMFMFSLMYLIM